MVVELRHRDVGEKPGTGPPAGDGMVRRGRLHDVLASPAGEGLAHVAHDLEAARHVVEALRHVLADSTQRTATSRTGAGTGMDDALARQMLGQAPPGRPDARGLHRLGESRRGRQVLGRVDLQCLDGQFELLDARPELLGGGAEPCPLQPGEFAAQLLDQRAGMDSLARHADDQALERLDVVG